LTLISWSIRLYSRPGSQSTQAFSSYFPDLSTANPANHVIHLLDPNIFLFPTLLIVHLNIPPLC